MDASFGGFPTHCGFPVIYFISNIFLPRPRKGRAARACQTPA